MITSMLARMPWILLAATAVLHGQGPAAPREKSDLSIPGAIPAAGVEGEIRIQVVGPWLDQVLSVQARDKVEKKDILDKIDVVLQISRLVGATDRRWIDATARWVDCAKEDKVCNPRAIAWQGHRELRVTANLPLLPQPQPYTGTLDLIYGGITHTFNLTVDRRVEDPPDLRDSDFTTEKAEFEIQTVLRSKKDSLYVTRVEAQPLIGTKVPPFPLKLAVTGKGPYALAPYSDIPLTITAFLPVADTYQGGIDVYYNGQRTPLKIKITRADSQAPLKIRLAGAAREGVDFGYFLASKVAVRFDLERQRSEPLVINLPRIVELARKDSDKGTSQATFTQTVQELDEKEKDWKPVTQPLIRLDGRLAKPLRILMEGLGPGEYSGTVSVDTKDLSAQEKPVTVTVRRSWFWAVVLIAMGVYASLRLRQWAQRDQPRLVAQRDISKVYEDLATVRDGFQQDVQPEEQEVLDFLGAQLKALFTRWDQGVVPNGDALLQDLAAKIALVPRWVTLRRQLEGMTLPPAVMNARRVDLRGIRNSFTGTDAAEATGQHIADVAGQVTKDLTDVILARIQSLKDELARQEQSGAGQILKAKLDAEVLGRLEQASAFAGNPDHLKEAALQVSEANLIMVTLLATGLGASLPATPPDAQISAEDWKDAVVAIRRELGKIQSTTDPDAAADAYKSAYALYLRTLLQAIRTRLDAADTTMAGLTDKTAHDSAQDKLQAARAMAHACDVLLAAGDTAGAQTQFETLATNVRDLERAIRPAAAREELAAPDVPVIGSSTVGGTVVRESAIFPGAPARIILPASNLDKKIKALELRLAVIGFILAVVIGLRMLWLASPTWGDLNDLTIAVLWGLGVHQASSAFLGQFDFAGLISRITGTKTPS